MSLQNSLFFLEVTAWATAKVPPSLPFCLAISLHAMFSIGRCSSPKSTAFPAQIDCNPLLDFKIVLASSGGNPLT